jgi:hypothetical protein
MVDPRRTRASLKNNRAARAFTVGNLQADISQQHHEHYRSDPVIEQRLARNLCLER